MQGALMRLATSVMVFQSLESILRQGGVQTKERAHLPWHDMFRGTKVVNGLSLELHHILDGAFNPQDLSRWHLILYFRLVCRTHNDDFSIVVRHDDCRDSATNERWSVWWDYMYGNGVRIPRRMLSFTQAQGVTKEIRKLSEGDAKKIVETCVDFYTGVVKSSSIRLQ